MTNRVSSQSAPCRTPLAARQYISDFTEFVRISLLYRRKMKTLNFKYNPKHLIRCVKERPCLWDKKAENFKSKFERKKAWKEIFRELIEGYENLPTLEKMHSGEALQSKWNNMRDTFVRSLRHIKNKNKKQKYYFHNCMKFLIQNEGDRQPDDSSTDCSEDERSASVVKRESEDEVEYEVLCNDITARGVASPKAVYQYECDGLKYENDSASASLDLQARGEDRSFFDSILPTVMKYNDDQRLEFRLQVLTAMKKINDTK